MKEYRKALPWLNIMSSNRPYGLVSEDIIEELDEKVKAQQAHINKQDTKLIEVENMYRTVEQPYVDALKKMQAAAKRSTISQRRGQIRTSRAR